MRGRTAVQRNALLTSGLLAETAADLAGLLEVDVPARGLAGLVLECEGEDGTALFDGVLALAVARVQGCVDDVEGLGGRELVCAVRIRQRLLCCFTG